MAEYRLDIIASLARQLAFAPAPVRDRQLAAAEMLALSLDPAKGYPPDYVIFRITGYNPKADPNPDQSELLTALALQHDLGLMIERVSDTLAHKTIDRAEPVLTIDDLAAKFDVTSKTIQRWRRRGLCARRFVFPDGKRRVGFRLSVVEAFMTLHRTDGGAAAVVPVQPSDGDNIVSLARHLATRCNCCRDEIARRVGRKLAKSPLTVLATLRKHDAENPAAAVLPLAAASLSQDARQAILDAVAAGSSLRDAAGDVPLPRAYRVVLQAKLDRLLERRVKFIDDSLYHTLGAEAAINEMLAQDALTAAPAGEAARVPGELPPYLRELYRTPLLSAARERALFLAFNFRKFQFVTARRRLDPANARRRDIDALQRSLNRAVAVKNEILQANLRLVVSVAKKHIRPGLSLMELVSEGNLVLMRAVEGFDVHKGNKFSTYATLALMKGFARTVPQLLAARGGAGDALVNVIDRGASPVDRAAACDEVDTLLSRLDRRDRAAVRARFGFDAVSDDSATAAGDRAMLAKLRAAAELLS